MTYAERKRQILEDISSSFWLKEQIAKLERRDVLDAFSDCQQLVALCQARWDEGKRAWELYDAGLITREEWMERTMVETFVGKSR